LGISIYDAQQFQSLFYWMYVKNYETPNGRATMELFQSLFYWMYVKNAYNDFFLGSIRDKFQSLFYWMYVKNFYIIFRFIAFFVVSILVLLDVCKELKIVKAEQD